jgi:hypothetical protein
MGCCVSERADMPLLVAVFDGAHPNAADVIASGCATPGRKSGPCADGLTDHDTGPGSRHSCRHPSIRSSACRTAPRKLAHLVRQAGQQSE